MENINIAFYEEFKKLEQICNQMYNNNTGKKHGIRAYIDDMYAVPPNIRNQIHGWYDDVRKLKEYNYKRNQISHNEVSFYDDYFTTEDIDWIINFRNRILNRLDPLALSSEILRKYNQHNANPPKASQYNPSYPDRKLKTSDHNNSIPNFLIAIQIILSTLAVFSIIFLIYALNQ